MLDPRVLEVIEPGRVYILPSYEVTDEGIVDAYSVKLQFCKGSKDDPKIPRQKGVFSESLIEAVKQYLETVNVGELATREASMVITKLDEALMWMNKRSEDRKRRGVQATYKK